MQRTKTRNLHQEPPFGTKCTAGKTVRMSGFDAGTTHTHGEANATYVCVHVYVFLNVPGADTLMQMHPRTSSKNGSARAKTCRGSSQPCRRSSQSRTSTAQWGWLEELVPLDICPFGLGRTNSANTYYEAGAYVSKGTPTFFQVGSLTFKVESLQSGVQEPELLTLLLRTSTRCQAFGVCVSLVQMRILRLLHIIS